jgi:hypothetical protein
MTAGKDLGAITAARVNTLLCLLQIGTDATDQVSSARLSDTSLNLV